MIVYDKPTDYDANNPVYKKSAVVDPMKKGSSTFEQYKDRGGVAPVGADGTPVKVSGPGKEHTNQWPDGKPPKVGDPNAPAPDGLGQADNGPLSDLDLPTEAGEMPGQDANYEADRGKATIKDVAEGVATQREVQDKELVSSQLSSLLSSDSKYIQDARRQGLEQANAMGGLGGTVGVGAAQTSALRAALPIAQNDAAAHVQAASENMQALNQMSQVNAQIAGSLEQSRMGAQAQLDSTTISANAQYAATKLTTAAQRDIAKLDADTKVLVTNMQGVLEKALAEDQFKYNQILNDAQYAANLANTQMQGEYGLAGTALGKQWDMEIQAGVNALNERSNYTTQATNIFSQAMESFANLNGTEMDEAAKKAAAATIWGFAKTQMDVVNALYPDQTPLEFDWPSGY